MIVIINISKGVDKGSKSEYNKIAFMNGHYENNDYLINHKTVKS